MSIFWQIFELKLVFQILLLLADFVLSSLLLYAYYIHYLSADFINCDCRGRFVVFTGGMPRASYGDRHTVTVMQGDDTHVVFDFTSRVVDFVILSRADESDTSEDRAGLYTQPVHFTAGALGGVSDYLMWLVVVGKLADFMECVWFCQDCKEKSNIYACKSFMYVLSGFSVIPW